jgi:hypothetical protein
VRHPGLRRLETQGRGGGATRRRSRRARTPSWPAALSSSPASPDGSAPEEFDLELGDAGGARAMAGRARAEGVAMAA